MMARLGLRTRLAIALVSVAVLTVGLATLLTNRGLEPLVAAYEDFVRSDALTEKVFKVFHLHEPHTVFVPLSEILH